MGVSATEMGDAVADTGGRRRLGPMKATTEATPAYTAGVLPDPFVARTFVDPAYTSGAPGSPVIMLPDMRNTN